MRTTPPGWLQLFFDSYCNIHLVPLRIVHYLGMVCTNYAYLLPFRSFPTSIRNLPQNFMLAFQRVYPVTILTSDKYST